jgi:4-hydroxybenzoate polyprenyltransferase
MEHVEKRRLRDVAHGFFLLSHPVPVLFHMIAVAGSALFAAFSHIVWETFVLVVAAHLAMQLSIAFLNDYCDRRLDALSKRDKPIVRGLVQPSEAFTAGLLLMVVMVLLLLPLPLLALLISCSYLALGQGYNFGLKSTPFSGVVFALAFPLIPLYAFAGMGHIPPVIIWLVPVAALLGCAINLANAVSDIEEDKANGAYTLAVTLGAKGVYWTCPTLILISILLIGVLTGTRTVQASPLFVGIAFVITIMGVYVLLSTGNVVQKRYFYLVVCTSFVIAAGWLLGVTL